MPLPDPPPPSPTLPPPEFTVWDDAVVYTRTVMARMKYLEAAVPVLHETAATAAIAEKEAADELAALGVVATTILAIGKALA
jgi:hypothetical protein